MENLQEDVLTLILSKLEDLSDLCSCAGVAKFFHRLHWPVLVLRRTNHDEERMARLVTGALNSRHMNGLQKLVIKSEQENIGVEKKDWLMLKKSQGSLRTLELNGCFNVPDLWGIIHGFPKLSILKLKDNAFRTPRSTLPISLPGLTTVSIIKSYYINDIQALVRACRASLETLRVECESHIETMDLRITDCPKLEELVIEGLPENKVIVEGCSKLEGLSFTWVSSIRVSNSCLALIQELELWEIDKLRNNHLYSILSACPMLQTLQLSGGEALKSPVVISCPTITSLNYARKDSRCPDFHDQLLLEPHVLRIECPSLQKLKISGDCCVVADFDVNIPEVTIAERWGYQNVKKVLCLSKSVLHLDISKLNMRAEDYARQSPGKSEIRLSVFYQLLQESLELRSIRMDLGDPHETAPIQKFLSSFFIAHPCLESVTTSTNYWEALQEIKGPDFYCAKKSEDHVVIHRA